MKIEASRFGWFVREAERFGIPQQMLVPPMWSNPSADLPYHGAAHLLRVAGLAMRFQLDTGLVPDEEMPALVGAALWHDYDHQQDADDRVNVEAAVRAYRTSGHDWTVEHRERFGDLTERLIRATLFPHQGANSIAERVIQDVDLLMTAEPDGELWAAALQEETGRAAAPLADWFAEHPPHTDWAKARMLAAIEQQASPELAMIGAHRVLPPLD